VKRFANVGATNGALGNGLMVVQLPLVVNRRNP